MQQQRLCNEICEYANTNKDEVQHDINSILNNTSVMQNQVMQTLIDKGVGDAATPCVDRCADAVGYVSELSETGWRSLTHAFCADPLLQQVEGKHAARVCDRVQPSAHPRILLCDEVPDIKDCAHYVQVARNLIP